LCSCVVALFGLALFGWGVGFGGGALRAGGGQLRVRLRGGGDAAVGVLRSRTVEEAAGGTGERRAHGGELRVVLRIIHGRVVVVVGRQQGSERRDRLGRRSSRLGVIPGGGCRDAGDQFREG